MVDPTIREYLIGYLLGALEEDEQQLVEESLAADENLRRELGLMSRALAPLDAAFDEHSPPPDLVAKTCELVQAHREGILVEETAQEPVVARSATTGYTATEYTEERSPQNTVVPADRPRSTTRHRMSQVSNVPRAKVSDWRWQDLVVSAIVIGLVFIAFVPGLLHQRSDARVLACQNNLRQLGNSLTDYSDRHDGFFPPIPTSGKMSVASAFGPLLANEELLPDPRVLLCPDSPQGEKFSKQGQEFRVPRPAEIERIESPQELLQTQQTMGGSYGYSLGYNQNGSYRPTKNLHRPYFAVLSDSPGSAETGHPSHHGGRGQNVLFEDGHVLFLTQAHTAGGRDDLFLNDAHQIAAGLHPNDGVIASGAVTP